MMVLDNIIISTGSTVAVQREGNGLWTHAKSLNMAMQTTMANLIRYKDRKCDYKKC